MTHFQKVWAGLTILTGIFLAFIFQFWDILRPFFFAFVLAYLLYPFVHQLQNRGFRKPLSIWIVFTLFSLLFFSMATFLVSMVRIEIPVVQAKIPLYIDYLQKKTIPDLERFLHLKLQKTTEEFIKDFTEKLLALSPGMANSISNFASQALSKTINVLIFFIDLLLIPVVMVYFLFDFEKINYWTPRVVPQAYQPHLKKHLQEIDKILRKYVGGQLLISALLAVIYMVGLTWIGIDLSVILGFFSALMNIVPYIGVLTGGIISTLFAFFKFHDISHILLVIGLFISGHLLDGYYLNPKIVGKKIGLHPLIVILSLLMGGKIFGLTGLIFAVPVAAILSYLLKVGFNFYQKSQFYSGRPL